MKKDTPIHPLNLKQELASSSDKARQGGGAFDRYKDPAYVAEEMRNLITIALTHCPRLVHNIKENSPESQFIQRQFGITYPIADDPSVVNTCNEIEKTINPAPVRGILMHSFNFQSARGVPDIEPEIVETLKDLDQKSQVTRGIITHKYDDFGQILDDLFPDWRKQSYKPKTENQTPLLESAPLEGTKAAETERIEKTETVYKSDDGEHYILA